MIAVLDDDEPVRKAVMRLLHAAGYGTRGYASGQELLQAWPSEPPDCLILDLQLPGISGLEVQRRLRLAGSQVPTIIMTASDEPRVRDECLAEGATTCLSKPLDVQALLGALDRARVIQTGDRSR